MFKSTKKKYSHDIYLCIDGIDLVMEEIGANNIPPFIDLHEECDNFEKVTKCTEPMDEQ